MGQTEKDKVLALARKAGMVRVRDLRERGMHPEHLRRLMADGLLVRAARGLYVPADAEPTAHHSLAQAAKQVPRGVVCLLSALRFHDLGTQSPFEIWLAIDRRARKPQVDGPRLHIVRFSGRALTEGVDEHKVEGVLVRVYNAAKTVADCFKYRNKLGLDVAMEAMREGLRERRFTRDKLWHYAKICRVGTVMRAYMEAIS